MSQADRERWEARWRERPDDPGPPEPFLVRHAAELPPGPTLVPAAGTGRNALWLAAQGCAVTAVDIAANAIARLEAAAAGQKLAVSGSDLLDDTVAAVQNWSERLGEEMLAQSQARLESQGIQL